MVNMEYRLAPDLLFVMVKSMALIRCKQSREFQKPGRGCTSGTWQVPKRYSSLPWQSSVEGKRNNFSTTVKVIDIFVSALFVCFSSDLSLHLKHVVTKPPDRLENNDMNVEFYTKFDLFLSKYWIVCAIFCVGHDEGLTEFESFCMIFPPRPFTSSLALACLNSTWPT